MIVKYQSAFKHEVWGNYKCYLKFFDYKGNLIYARNIFCHEMLHYNIENTAYFLKSNNSNFILIYEYSRTNIPTLSLLDFDNQFVYRMNYYEHTYTPLNTLELKETDIEFFEQNGKKSTFCKENIKLPLFKRWSKPKVLF